MKSYFEPVRNWFGFDRRERRSALILVLIIILIIVIRFIVPERNLAIDEIITSFSDTESESLITPGESISALQLFRFNPNTVSYDTLLRLGFDPVEARTLLSYRSKGGKFRQPSDIKKVYGIEESKAEKLIPFVKLIPDTLVNDRTKLHKQQRSFIDINRCDSAMLDRLPGIGPVLSARIIKYRKLLGGFARADQLMEVYGLPEETYNLIRERIKIDTSVVIKINVNTSGFKEIARMIYFERYEVSVILKYRELMGNVKSMSELVENNIITREKAEKVAPYLRFD